MCSCTMYIHDYDDAFGKGCSMSMVHWYMTNPRVHCAPDRNHQKSCPAAAIIVVRVCQSVTPLV